jgi:hypothetical protein
MAFRFPERATPRIADLVVQQGKLIAGDFSKPVAHRRAAAEGAGATGRWRVPSHRSQDVRLDASGWRSLVKTIETAIAGST